MDNSKTLDSSPNTIPSSNFYNYIEIDSEETNTSSFNFSKFRDFRRRLNNYLNNKYGKGLKVIFTNKKDREAILKYALGFDGKNDIFNSGRDDYIGDLNLDKASLKVIYDIKDYTKRTLYGE